MTLDEIAIKHGTDKATRHPFTPHGYAPHYELAFSDLRQKNIKLLEIGVGSGESIKTWLEFFPFAKIFGMDITQDTNEWNDILITPNVRYTFMQGDQSNSETWCRLIEAHGGNFDIIVDDGGHKNSEIIIAYGSLWKHVSPGGFYCIEDLAVCYGTLYTVPGFPGHMDFIRSILDSINQTSDIESLRFSRELAILRKKA